MRPRKRQRKKNLKRVMDSVGIKRMPMAVPSFNLEGYRNFNLEGYRNFNLEGYRNFKVEVVSTGSGDDTLTLDMPTGQSFFLDDYYELPRPSADIEITKCWSI